MDTQELLRQARSLRQRIQPYAAKGTPGLLGEGAKAQVCEFLRAYAGPKSAFLTLAEQAGGYDQYKVATLTGILDSFIQYVESGLASGLSPERKAQLDVVADVLEQADRLLQNEQYHPAAAVVLVGASLEEFLRNWVEAEGLSIGNAKPGIDTYCKTLRVADLISKQDVKDITCWAGVRNHAAHGDWAEVSDCARARLMLEGVNLFMRQKGG